LNLFITAVPGMNSLRPSGQRCAGDGSPLSGVLGAWPEPLGGSECRSARLDQRAFTLIELLVVIASPDGIASSI
jgi:hypothetical protein